MDFSFLFFTVSFFVPFLYIGKLHLNIGYHIEFYYLLARIRFFTIYCEHNSEIFTFLRDFNAKLSKCLSYKTKLFSSKTL